MRIPNIQFNESNVGVTPISSNIRNRIGIVGEFSRGPANTPSFLSGFSDFANRYGSDTKKGSMAVQAAFDQGAEEFALIRVLGGAKIAKGTIQFSNPATKANTLLFNLRFIGDIVDYGTVPVTSTIVTSGKYTGTQSGRYYFKVTAIASGSATVKYQFVALGADQTSFDWTTVSNTITVSLTADKGVAKTIANGVSIAFGTSGQSSDIDLRINNEFSVRVNAYTYSIPINQNDLPNQIVTNMVSQLSGVEPLGELTKTATDDGLIFALDASLAGQIGNKYSYYFDLADPVTPGTTLSISGVGSSVFMQGGSDGPRNAVKDFYTLDSVPLLRLIAVSEGAWGNQLRATIYPLNNKQFRLLIEDLTAANYNPTLTSESYILDFSDLDDRGFLNQLKTSKFVRGIFLPKFTSPLNYNVALVAQSPQRVAIYDSTVTDATSPKHSSYYGPTKLVQVALTNGYDGPAVTETDYIQALGVLESAPVHIVLCPGIYQSLNVKAALIAHAEKCSELEGLRVVILNARPNLTPNAAAQETFGLDSKRAVMVAGWSTYAGQPAAPRYGLSPDAVYAGKLASIPYFSGPHSRRTAGRVLNITEVDTRNYSSASSLQIFTDAKLEILGVDPAAQAFVFINGRTLSSDTAWERIYIRRTYDVIRQDLADALQQYKSEPHTDLLRRQITAAINAYLNEKVRLGELANYSPAIADNSNNTPENYVANQLNISVSILPIYAADYITLTLVRDSGAGTVSFGV